jgi:hypothetical protein
MQKEKIENLRLMTKNTNTNSKNQKSMTNDQ